MAATVNAGDRPKATVTGRVDQTVQLHDNESRRLYESASACRFESQ